MSDFEILTGDCREKLASIEAKSVRCCVTSPPYFGLRNYGNDNQLGQESKPDDYVKEMVALFRQVWRVLADDGTLWLNLGDSYRSKQLLGIPWRVALALQVDGWYLRSDIIWAKPNPMPESVADRPTKSHEHLFLFSKDSEYYYDAMAIAEDSVGWNGSRFDVGKTAEHQGQRMQRRNIIGKMSERGVTRTTEGLNLKTHDEKTGPTKNKRDVWTISTEPFAGAHFAVMPPELVKPCVLAGSAEGDTILDPFAGSGTVGVVALRHQRNFVGIELNPVYAEMARRRIEADGPLLNRENVSEPVGTQE
jgi:DNA modification methylase